MLSPLAMKMQGAIKQKIMDEKKKKIGFDTLMFVQDLKLFHNEFDLPTMID